MWTKSQAKPESGYCTVDTSQLSPLFTLYPTKL